MIDNLPFLESVAAGLRAQGIIATVGHPGTVEIALPDGMTLATGLHGFVYGSLITPDGNALPDPPSLPLSADATAVTVARAWARWARLYRVSPMWRDADHDADSADGPACRVCGHPTNGVTHA